MASGAYAKRATTAHRSSVQASEITDRIRKSLGKMSGGARSVAEFVLARPEDVAMLPAAQVADRLGISESTVTRFAVLLGYKGYPALRRDSQSDVRRHLAPPQRLELISRSANDKQRSSSMVFQQDIESILRTERGLTTADMDNAVALISKAQTIHVIGLRSSFGLAHCFWFQLNQMLGNAVLFDTARGDSLEQLRCIGALDLVICISFPRHQTQAVEAVRYAHSRHAKIIAVTDGPMSLVAADADILFTVNTPIVNVLTSLSSCMSLLNAISSEVLLMNCQRAAKNLADLEHAMGQAKVHFQGSSRISVGSDPGRTEVELAAEEQDTGSIISE